MNAHLPKHNRYSLFPKHIAKSIEPLIKPIYKKHGFAEYRILTEWNKIAGDDLASCSLPQKLTSTRNQHGGILHILAASGRALELQHMEPVILDRIATYFGYRAVQKIKFTQTSSSLFRKSISRKPEEKGVISEKLAALVGECTDEELRNILLLLGSRLKL